MSAEQIKSAAVLDLAAARPTTNTGPSGARRKITRLLIVTIFMVVVSCASCASALADDVLAVNQARGSDVGSCQVDPCQTIGYALSQAAEIGGSTSLKVAAGEYPEDIRVPAGLDTVTIVGAGEGTDSTDTIIVGSSGAPTIDSGSAVSVSLADMRVIDPSSDEEDMVSSYQAANLSLARVALDQQGSEGNPINALTGSVTFSEGSISIDDSAASGYAINSHSGDITVDHSRIVVAGGGYGLNAVEGTITATSTKIDLTNTEQQRARPKPQAKL